MSFWRDWLKNRLLKRQIILSRPPGQFNIGPYKLARLRDRGFKLNLALDGGAATGHWAEEFKTIYPDAHVLCVEPRDDVQAELKSRADRLGQIHIAQTLLGPEDGTTTFYVSADQSSTLPNSGGAQFGTAVQAPVARLDTLIEKMKLPWPDLLKLDLQGFELQALAGATRCLQETQAVLLEVSFIALQTGTPLAAQVIGFMQERGFRVYDILALWHRPLDGALAQGDFLFLREDHPLLKDRRWSDEAKWA